MDILRMIDAQHARLKTHLHDGSGLEAVAVGLCGRGGTPERPLFALHEIVEIPHGDCWRSPVSVRWPTRALRALLARAKAEGLAVIKFHSHPKGAHFFSGTDDISDADLFSAVGLKVPGDHLSAIMLPDGEVFARRLASGAVVGEVARVSVVGDDLLFWDASGLDSDRTRDFDLRHRQAFGDRTTRILSQLSIAIVGVSGTGSPIVELLARLGVGRIVLVEFDVVEAKNLNRIWGTRRAHAEAKINKAHAIKTHIDAIGLGTVIEVVEDRIEAAEAIARVSSCDMVFGCMDSVEGRDTLNRLATFYALPYIDMGVRLDADGDGGIASISAGVHYLVPGRSSLRSRGVYNADNLRAEYLYRTDPVFYADQVRRGYIKGVDVDRPAVISINAAVASAAVNELLARLHPFRTRLNANFAVQKILFTHGRTVNRAEGDADASLAAYVGRGNALPPLLLPRLSKAA
ncbi:ThiF family adenylyltransferase [Sphingopyxis sp.]|uniref:HesA/MoeB/ThiF family protein n=1 Tax=Sphingopyxis sp. TaxID=1908224 RepID=UPI002B46D162|nr:ThiF family adenylyltransferase [Sphingopyxis sp.]HJS13170.1 ThiF family adenylyltransferase [Sphingopyxis sp.]